LVNDFADWCFCIGILVVETIGHIGIIAIKTRPKAMEIDYDRKLGSQAASEPWPR
jgi:hypothetical protein